MVQDSEGRWWAKHRETGEWNYFDGGTWIQGTPTGYQAATAEPPTDESPMRSSPPRHLRATEHAENRQKVLPWVLGAGLVGVIAVIAVVMYLAGNIGGAQKAAEVPQVVGKSRDQAEKELRSAGFEVAVKTRESSVEDAGKVIEQSPSSGEAEKNSAVAITVGEEPSEQAKVSEKKPGPAQNSGPAPDYNIIQDPTGGLTIEVPPSWGVQTAQDSEGMRGSWSTLAGYDITSSITTAPNLDAWYSDQPPATGAYIVASRELAQTYTDQQLLNSGPWANWETNCDAGPYENFDRYPYSGKKQTWFCPSGRTFYMVAAAPEGRECVVLLQLAVPTQAASEADREAVKHILDTFEVNCGGIARAKVGKQSIGAVAYVTSINVTSIR